MKKNSEGYTIKDIKDFAKYITDTYVELNPFYEDSRIYIQLKDFYEKGIVKDIIYKNKSLDDKQEWVESVARKINKFGEHIILRTKINKIKTKIKDYED
jgi:hypothetical protein